MAATAARTNAVARDLRDTVTVGRLEVDRAPVTNGRYATFVAATGHRPPLYWPKGECPPSLLRHPVTGVDFFDALAFALWSGGSIPTEDEWLAAAGLEEPSAYVWGDFFDSKRCNTAKSGIKGTTPVDAYPQGAAPSGCVDLCGNVWEMTCTAFPGDSDSIIVKGGSWSDLPAHARLDTQFRTRVNKGSSNVGFRLVYGVPGLLPYFIDRELVDQCIAFRRADAPHFDAQGDASEFEAIVESLRQTAGPHLARLEAEARASFVGSETGSPAPAAPPFRRRLGAAAREIAKASFWRKIMPVLRVFAQPGRSRSIADRFRAAWAEGHRPRRGPPLRQAFAAAAVALFPDRGRALRARLLSAAKDLFRSGGLRARLGRAHKVRGKKVPGKSLVTVRPPASVVKAPAAARESLLSGFAKHPRRVFVLLCVFAGSVLGFLGTTMRDRKGQERAPVAARAAVAEAEPRRPAPAPEPPKAPAAEAAPKKELPATTKELTPEDVEAVLRRLEGGRPQERDEAERFLVWHRAETETRVRAALATRLEPQVRAALEYVVAAMDEEKSTRGGVPTVKAVPPRRGLVLFCDSPDAADFIAMVRRTAKAARLDVTVVLAGAQAARVAERHAIDLGDVDLYLDADGSLAKGMRVERLPAVAGLRADGSTAFLTYGRVQRSRLAEQVLKLGDAK